MKIAVVGCAHGELKVMYDTIKTIEDLHKIKINLLICCGDFQATRNESDLRCMAVPEKYYNMGSFYKYYSQEQTAPVLTVFIGGNHEASNYLQELEYGGWVAPNIYYMGYAGVINVGGIRIGGISGIYKGHDYMKGRFEKSPYDDRTKRSVYHIRSYEVFQLKQLQEPLDVMISHDWPRGVHKYGFESNLLANKPFFRNDINENKLGSIPCEELLFYLKPTYWFSAHLHTKFAALIPHTTVNDNKVKYTRFLALDKCLPGKDFMQVIDIPHRNDDLNLSYDLEWLTILSLTNHLISTEQYIQFMPGPKSEGRWKFTPTDEEKQFVLEKFYHNLKIPTNFTQTVPAYLDGRNSFPCRTPPLSKSTVQPDAKLNPQTHTFCDVLGIENRMGLLMLDGDTENFSPSQRSYDQNVSNTTFIDDTVLDDGYGGLSEDNVKNVSGKQSPVANSEYDSSNSASVNNAVPADDALNSNLLKRNRSQLLLPSPKFDDDSSFSSSGDSALKSVSILASSLPLSASVMSDKHIDQSNEDNNGDTNENAQKKFKRRNQLIYDNCEL